MTHSQDLQLCDMIGVEAAFRAELSEAFGRRSWIITKVSEDHTHAETVGMPDDFDQATVSRRTRGKEVTYDVGFGEIHASAYTLRDAANRARSRLSNAVRALQSVGWEVEP